MVSTSRAARAALVVVAGMAAPLPRHRPRRHNAIPLVARSPLRHHPRLRRGRRILALR